LQKDGADNKVDENSVAARMRVCLAILKIIPYCMMDWPKSE